MITKLVIISLFALFLMPSPLILFAALFNWNVIRTKPLTQNLKELGSSVFSAGCSLFLAVTTRPFLFLKNIPLRHKNGDQRPILMVHGLYHNNTAWLLMKPRLNRMGFSNLNTWQYNSFTTSYPELVLKLRKEILRLNEKQGCKVMLIGHSLGGLLISGAAMDPAVEKAVCGLITMGTPFKGSVLAHAAPGRLGRSLRPGSPLFKGPNCIRYPGLAPKKAFISPTDEMVLPWSNLEPENGGWEIEKCPAMGHVAMLYHPGITEKIAATIREMRQNEQV